MQGAWRHCALFYEQIPSNKFHFEYWDKTSINKENKTSSDSLFKLKLEIKRANRQESWLLSISWIPDAMRWNGSDESEFTYVLVILFPTSSNRPSARMLATVTTKRCLQVANGNRFFFLCLILVTTLYWFQLVEHSAYLHKNII